ncbi:MAG TPA: hypothetical protein VKY85_18320 [Candidatus Angelobacter sp.]|nr:hypothetical protein [Candidatus Angelobacter sp.]
MPVDHHLRLAADISRDPRDFQTLLDHVEDGGGKEGLEEFLRGFPTVTREQALVALVENNKLDLLK